MKKFILTSCLIMATTFFVSAQNVKLPEPDKNVSMTLYQAL